MQNLNATSLELDERLKELSCLYEITAIGAMFHNQPHVALSKIVQRLPLAWMHPETAVAEINIDGETYQSKYLPKEPLSQTAAIFINSFERGVVKMHYPRQSNVHFLNEEQDLIEKVAHEIGIIVERAELRSKERELERKMQRSDRLAILGEITAGIAHEINTPLASILGFSQFIHDNSDDRQTIKDADKIIQSAMHAREIVKKLMLFSCDMPGDIKESNINDIIINSLKLIKPKVQEADIQLTICPDPNNVCARIDPVQITQVVFNLVINAIYATKPGGRIGVKINSDSKHFSIEVQDDGMGISSEVQSKMFEPFYTTKQLGEGSGLGLSVVHGIVKSHGGDVNVESKIDVGTRFLIQIPLGSE